jgi:hypothetical protein
LLSSASKTPVKLIASGIFAPLGYEKGDGSRMRILACEFRTLKGNLL